MAGGRYKGLRYLILLSKTVLGTKLSVSEFKMDKKKYQHKARKRIIKIYLYQAWRRL